jgi:hypothetical protein
MRAAWADVAPAADLLDVFNSLSSSSLFPGLTAGVNGQPPILGRIGWIFAGFGAVFTLWGFVLRTRHTHGGDKLPEVVRTWLIFAAMLAGPMLMRTAMQGADAVYASTIGGPGKLAYACARAAYAMPEVTALFDLLRQSPNGTAGSGATAPGATPATGASGSANAAGDGTLIGYLKSFGVTFWQAASQTAATFTLGWSGILKFLALANGLGAAALKCYFVTLTVIVLYLVLLVAAAIAWVMEQIRFFLAVTGTMMLPLFLGLLSLPEGHPNRGPAHAYVMHLLSLALWPVAWAIGHTGTIALYNALMALVSGTSRVPAIAELLQWSAITTGDAYSAAQVQSLEAALGNWFMGNLVSMLGLVVLGTAFVLWVLAVSVLGPMFLHKLLTTGAHFMSQAAASSAQLGLGALQRAGNPPSYQRAVKGRDLSDLGGGRDPGAAGRSRSFGVDPSTPVPSAGFGQQGDAGCVATMDGAARSLAASAPDQPAEENGRRPGLSGV